jgi:hypothetical protein
MGIHDEINWFYKINVIAQVFEINSIQINFKRKLWHRHLRHLHYQGLHIISTESKTMGLPSIPMIKNICRNYMLRKQHLESVLKHNNTRAKVVNELIH